MTAKIRAVYDGTRAFGSQEDKQAAAEILRSEVFVFDETSFADGVLTASWSYGADLSRFGLLRLPFDRCVFQCPVLDEDANVTDWQVLVARQDTTGIRLRIYWEFAGHGLQRPRFTSFVPNGMIFPSNYRGLDYEALTIRDHNALSLQILDGEMEETIWAERRHLEYTVATASLLAFLGLLAAKGVLREHHEGPKSLNERRLKKGKAPIFSFWWVKHDPSFLKLPGVSASGTHAPPRLHLRRGHIRRLHSGALTNVRPCLVGSPEAGVVEKAYRIAHGGAA